MDLMTGPSLYFIFRIYLHNSYFSAKDQILSINMKKFHFLLMTSLTLLMAWQCKSTRYTPQSLPDEQIKFGSGGGFTGIETTYYLLENGQIFMRTGVNSEFSELPSTSKKKAKKFYQQIKALQNYESEDAQPGNVYFFITHKEGDMMRRIAWSDPPSDKMKSLSAFYKTLANLLKVDK